MPEPSFETLGALARRNYLIRNLEAENERLRAVLEAARKFVEAPADRDGFERLVRTIGMVDTDGVER